MIGKRTDPKKWQRDSYSPIDPIIVNDPYSISEDQTIQPLCSETGTNNSINKPTTNKSY